MRMPCICHSALPEQESTVEALLTDRREVPVDERERTDSTPAQCEYSIEYAVQYVIWLEMKRHVLRKSQPPRPSRYLLLVGSSSSG